MASITIPVTSTVIVPNKLISLFLSAKASARLETGITLDMYACHPTLNIDPGMFIRATNITSIDARLSSVKKGINEINR